MLGWTLRSNCSLSLINNYMFDCITIHTFSWSIMFFLLSSVWLLSRGPVLDLSDPVLDLLYIFSIRGRSHISTLQWRK